MRVSAFAGIPFPKHVAKAVRCCSIWDGHETKQDGSGNQVEQTVPPMAKVASLTPKTDPVRMPGKCYGIGKAGLFNAMSSCKNARKKVLLPVHSGQIGSQILPLTAFTEIPHPDWAVLVPPAELLTES